MSRKKPEGAAEAAELKKARAVLKRAQANSADNAFEADILNSEATVLEETAINLLDPYRHATHAMRAGNGGEFLVNREGALTASPGFRDTVYERADMLAAEASLQRLELAGELNVVTLAVDMAESIGAKNSVERALAHQMAAAHKLAMQMAAKADHFTSLCQSWDTMTRQQLQSIEAARMAAASARMMDAFGRAAMTLERLRNGGRQVVTVQHVNVANGGQAVVGGVVKTRGRKRD
jgi:hypothetical protein